MNALFLFCVFNRVVKSKFHTSAYTREGFDNKTKKIKGKGRDLWSCLQSKLSHTIYTYYNSEKTVQSIASSFFGRHRSRATKCFFFHLHLISSPHVLSTNINPRMMRVHK